MLLAVTFKRMGGTADRIELEMIADRGKMTEQIRSFDAAKAQCFKQEDRQKLLAVIEAGFGDFDVFNKAARQIFAEKAGIDIDITKSGRIKFLTRSASSKSSRVLARSSSRFPKVAPAKSKDNEEGEESREQSLPEGRDNGGGVEETPVESLQEGTDNKDS